MRWPQSYSSVASIPRGTVITGLVSELRDIFHTAVDVGDAAGLIPAGHFKPEDGKSLLCLLKDPTGATCDYAGNPGPWRQALDMEHSTCYNESNHWNALTDGSIKYVFRAFFGDEQLFNLTADKYELEELSNDPLYVSLLHTSTSQVVACLCMRHAACNIWHVHVHVLVLVPLPLAFCYVIMFLSSSSASVSVSIYVRQYGNARQPFNPNVSVHPTLFKCNAADLYMYNHDVLIWHAHIFEDIKIR